MITRKKKILIFIVFLFVIIAILSGIYSVIYIKTDLLKSDQDLFYKYALQNEKILNLIDRQEIEKYKSKINEGTYANSGEITFDFSLNNGKKEINKAINNSKIKFEGVVDTSNRKNFQDIKLIYSNEEKEIFNIKYQQEDELYGLKTDEIVTKFVTIENNEITQLLNRLGKNNSNNIVEKIEMYDYNRIFDILQKNNLKKYEDVLNQHIPKRNYMLEKEVHVNVKDRAYMANKYTVKLTGNEEINVKVKLLETLLEDDEILKEYNKLIQRNESNIKIIKTKIQEKISEIKRQPVNPNVSLEISIYEKNKQLIKTEIIALDYSITIENIDINDGQEVIITKKDQKQEETYSIIKKKYNNMNEVTFNYSVIENEKIQSKIELILKNEYINNDLINDSIDIKMKNELGEQSIKYSNKKEFNKEYEQDSLKENAVILNEMTLDYNQNILSAIKERLVDIYRSRAENVGLDPNKINSEYEDIVKTLKDEFNREEFERLVQKALNYIKQDELVDEEYKKELQSKTSYEDKKRIKEKRLVKRLNEFGIPAQSNEENRKILIDSGFNYNYAYIIDYDSYIVTRDE